MRPERIHELLKLGEGSRVEFKTTLLRAFDPIGKVVCSFLNTSGGYVLCGVADKGRVVGVDVTDDQLASFERRLFEAISPTVLVAVERMELEGKQVVLIEVAQGRDLPFSFKGVIYMRVGDAVVPASPATIRDMVLRSQIEPERWERRFSLADMERDLDHAEVVATVRDADAVKRAFFANNKELGDTLEKLSVARYGRLTNGGDVLFTKDAALRFPQTRVRAYRYASDKAGDTLGDIKSFEGPLHTLFQQAYGFIVQNTPTKATFPKGSPVRRESPVYPEMAVREALINALVHRDYASPAGGVSIHIYPKRLEISNSGPLPDGVTPESLLSGQLSVLRNPDIAHVLYLRGLMEKAGRGSVLILQACQGHGLPRPEWTSSESGVTLTFHAPHGVPHVTPHVTPHGVPHVTPHVKRLLKVAKGEMSRAELMDALAIKDRVHFMDAYLRPALAAGVVEMTIPDKPKSVHQRYRRVAG